MAGAGRRTLDRVLYQIRKLSSSNAQDSPKQMLVPTEFAEVTRSAVAAQEAQEAMVGRRSRCRALFLALLPLSSIVRAALEVPRVLLSRLAVVRPRLHARETRNAGRRSFQASRNE